MKILNSQILNSFTTKSIRKNGQECNSMVTKAAFGPGDLDSNPDWFAIPNSNPKLSFHK